MPRPTIPRFRALPLLVSGLIILTMPTGTLWARILTVHSDSAQSTIAGAIASADAHDTVVVCEGFYHEHDLTIDRPLSITGRGEAVVDARGQGGIFIVTAPRVTIRDLHLTGVPTSFSAEHAAILLEATDQTTIEGNTIDGCFFGVYLANSQNSRLRNNTIRSRPARLTSAGNGIHLWHCRNISIVNNTVIGHRDGIYMEFVRTSTVDSNTCRSNLRYGLHFMFSDSCRYADNLFHSNTSGVAVMYTGSVIMSNNTFENSWGAASYGLLLKDIRDSRVEENRFLNNSTGIHMEGSDRILLARNLFKDNGWAIKLMANCLDNTITANDFIDNSFAVATNSRHNHSQFERNYWSTYRGIDLDRDGYGDMPFRPVSLFSLLVESHPPTLVLLRSLLVDVLDLAEQAIPTLTPKTLIDSQPRMRPNL